MNRYDPFVGSDSTEQNEVFFIAGTHALSRMELAEFTIHPLCKNFVFERSPFDFAPPIGKLDLINLTNNYFIN